jgi:hypothetical protein
MYAAISFVFLGSGLQSPAFFRLGVVSDRSILLLRCSLLGRGGRPGYDDPERRLTLLQADQDRRGFAAILDELAFLREQVARLPPVQRLGGSWLRLTLGALAAIRAAALLWGR